MPHFIPGDGSTALPTEKVAEGTEVDYRHTAPVQALAPNFKDAASYNVQYLDVDQD
ncbi:MAG: hypothetical protein IPO32_17995 [Crocinitomicaceae bacterium]|nr:hypothetical protein [Crocinitomicaceae bacterium]